MIFLIQYKNLIDAKHLIYDIDECSFFTEPSIYGMNFDIVINKLNLSAIDTDNKIAQLWGFCGYKEWKKIKSTKPQSRLGILKVVDDLEPGFAYKVNEDDFPISVNVQTGWICIGDPEKQGNAVEFMNNSIAVIDSSGYFISLWLKIEKLSDFYR